MKLSEYRIKRKIAISSFKGKIFIFNSDKESMRWLFTNMKKYGLLRNFIIATDYLNNDIVIFNFQKITITKQNIYNLDLLL